MYKQKRTGDMGQAYLTPYGAAEGCWSAIRGVIHTYLEVWVIARHSVQNCALCANACQTLPHVVPGYGVKGFAEHVRPCWRPVQAAWSTAAESSLLVAAFTPATFAIHMELPEALCDSNPCSGGFWASSIHGLVVNMAFWLWFLVKTMFWWSNNAQQQCGRHAGVSHASKLQRFPTLGQYNLPHLGA